MKRLLAYLAWDLPAFMLGFLVGYIAADYRHCHALGYHAVLTLWEGKLCVRDRP